MRVPFEFKSVPVSITVLSTCDKGLKYNDSLFSLFQEWTYTYIHVHLHLHCWVSQWRRRRQVGDGLKGRHIAEHLIKAYPLFPYPYQAYPLSPSDFHETYTRNWLVNGRGEGRWLMGRMKTYCHIADAHQHLIKSVEYQNSKSELVANYPDNQKICNT